jgi:hypothetical protein
VTTGQFGEVDLDLLADYLGGALTDTPEETVVARLVREDPDWAVAHAALTRALDSVQDSLAGWGTAAEPMPAEITDRLTAALAGATDARADAAASDGQPALPAQPTDQPERRLTAVPGGADRATRDQGRRAGPARRRWSRLAGPVAVAAAVVAVAGFGLSQLAGSTGGSDSAGPAAYRAEDAPAAASGAPSPLTQPAPERLVATGTDYRPATLAGMVSVFGDRGSDTERTGPEPDSAPGRSSFGAEASSQPQDAVAAPAGLGRLVAPDALVACLDTVVKAHAAGPVTVRLVDYAAWEGAPALVIAFTDQTGARWAWVSGPDCGLPASGADTLHQAQVG